MAHSGKTLTLCADDFGLNGPVSSGIIALARAGRLQAVSCMTQGPAWPQYADQLLPLSEQVDLGLHFNLTESFTENQAIPLGQLMRQSLFRQLDTGWLETTLQAQWQAFTDVIGRQPDFIDGHQHVHQFGQVRDVVFHFLIAQGFSGWVRTLVPVINGTKRFGLLAKSWLLQRLGGQRWQAMIEPHWTYPTAFGGVYDFHPQADYHYLMQRWMQALPTQALLMCHPAEPSPAGQVDPHDPIAIARIREYQYLMSDAFLEDSQRAGITWQPLVRKS